MRDGTEITSNVAGGVFALLCNQKEELGTDGEHILTGLSKSGKFLSGLRFKLQASASLMILH